MVEAALPGKKTTAEHFVSGAIPFSGEIDGRGGSGVCGDLPTIERTRFQRLVFSFLVKLKNSLNLSF
jgi:hypothetical protein